jgi:lipopolysaccharide/colanic/teichoic acid biosynthesis glycosyltransferase
MRLAATEGTRGDASRRASRARASSTVLDLVAGTLLALGATPVIVLAALGSAITLRAWPFFVQRRVGLRGREFRCVKLRTLPRGTSRTLDKYALGTITVPRFARWLRATHVDELPQLWLVPLRRMSLVGPRPEMPEIEARYPERLRSVRRTVRPGCTGLWQISIDAGKMIYEAPEYDECYVAHQSLRLDLWILWRTVAMIVGRRPAITLADLEQRGWVTRHVVEPGFAAGGGGAA